MRELGMGNREWWCARVLEYVGVAGIGSGGNALFRTRELHGALAACIAWKAMTARNTAQ